ncbi:hypothetical protein Tco_1176001 [Tanacetum coccineum]
MMGRANTPYPEEPILRIQGCGGDRRRRRMGVVERALRSLVLKVCGAVVAAGAGSDNEDANEHIKRVLEIVDLFTIPNVTQDQLMLLVFPVSLNGAASRWLRNEPTGSITTWEILKGKFLSKYYPPSCTAKWMEEINNFQQEPDETLYQAWERIKETYCFKMCYSAQLNNLGREINKCKKKERYLKKHTTLNLEYHSPKKEDIEQLLQDSTKEIMEILRIKNEGKQ